MICFFTTAVVSVIQGRQPIMWDMDGCYDEEMNILQENTKKQTDEQTK